MKKPLQKEKRLHNLFLRARKNLMFVKIFQKKTKNFKPICAVLDYSKPNIFFVGQPLWQTFFQALTPPPAILVLLRPCDNKDIFFLWQIFHPLRMAVQYKGQRSISHTEEEILFQIVVHRCYCYVSTDMISYFARKKVESSEKSSVMKSNGAKPKDEVRED